jgi:hypothetical protein
MIKIENTEVFGWETAIRGMRNPMNSWDKIDTDFSLSGMQSVSGILVPTIGNNDLSLMRKLCRAGSDHRKFLRMIVVSVDITAPLYWWKEFDTYKVGTVANSCSTMHKIHSKEFTLDDFSSEHLTCGFFEKDGSYFESAEVLKRLIYFLNTYRGFYLKTKDKQWWWQIIQLLPTSYNQKRTLMLNYEVLLNMYHARKNHKLDEWHTFCEWIESLPCSFLITQKGE